MIGTAVKLVLHHLKEISDKPERTESVWGLKSLSWD